jgi:hypothetical protein
MDPNAAWLALSEAVARDDWQTAAQLAEGLLAWLDRDGFPPTITGVASFDTIVARHTCEAIAAWEVC